MGEVSFSKILELVEGPGKWWDWRLLKLAQAGRKTEENVISDLKNGCAPKAIEELKLKKMVVHKKVKGRLANGVTVTATPDIMLMNPQVGGTVNVVEVKMRGNVENKDILQLMFVSAAMRYNREMASLCSNIYLYLNNSNQLWQMGDGLYEKWSREFDDMCLIAVGILGEIHRPVKFGKTKPTQTRMFESTQELTLGLGSDTNDDEQKIKKYFNQIIWNSNSYLIAPEKNPAGFH